MTIMNLNTLDTIREVYRIRESFDDNSEEQKFLAECFLLNPQSYGAKIEKRFIKINGFKKVSSSENKGDTYNPKTNRYFEIKSSLSNKNKFNLVQIRLWQNVDYYTIFVNLNDSDKLDISVCHIPHDDMVEYVNKYAASAHGTNSINTHNTMVEKRITVTPELVEELKNKYLISKELLLRNEQ